MARRRTPQSVLRRLSAGNATRLAAVPTPPPAQRVDDAELDQLRAELVHELDGRAARDNGGSATFRRVA